MLNQPPQGDETERRRGREASDQKEEAAVGHVLPMASDQARQIAAGEQRQQPQSHQQRLASRRRQPREHRPARRGEVQFAKRSEEHTSELQSLMRISYAVFCLKKKKTHKYRHK